ncbi:MAG TPA: hypothetical protein VHS06_06295 [Chloroflexota bacterium]|nr:hypothetical protein [Chloroflexota bacterium]
MRRHSLLICLALAAVLLLGTSASAEMLSPGDLDYDIPNGHFFTQTNGRPLGTDSTGYAVTNDDGVPFWDAFQRYGGKDVLGYPVTKRFMYDGFVTQAMQKVVFQWRPDVKQVWFLNTFDALQDKGKNDWLLVYRQTPKPFDTSPDNGLSWDQVVARHLALLDQNQPIKDRYFSDPQYIDHFGLPVSTADMGNSFVIRAQRATFQYWKEDVPWAKAGDVSVANGGDLAKEAGLWPADALTLSTPDGRPAGQPAAALQAAATPKPAATPQPANFPPYNPTPGLYRAASPEYGIHSFVFSHPDTAVRTFRQVTDLGFGWNKSLVEWKWVEPLKKGEFDWYATDGVVYGSAGQGLKLVVRVDLPPAWATKKNPGQPESPPDYLQDYADFVYALVSRYNNSNPRGRIYAIEVWNEPNLADYWGGKKPNAAEYVQMLKVAYEAAKRADPSVVVLSAGLGPTGTNNDSAIPDDVFLQQMYDAGARSYFDVLGAHAPGFKAPPEMSGDQVAADPAYGGHRVFTFRRVEDLRNVMVKNGDSGKQVWITEFGWTSDTVHPAYAWHRVTEEQKGQYLVRAMQWAKNNWAPWIGVMCVWNLPSQDWTNAREELWWSIANPDGSPRTAYTMIQQARRSGVLP